MDEKKVKLSTGLRRMAKFVDEHPEAFPTGKIGITFSTFETKQMLIWRDTFPERSRLHDSGSAITFYQNFGPVELTIYFFRNDQNCAKVKTGTHMVTKKNDQAVADAIAAIPDVEVEEDIMEWKCLDEEDEA